jgi:cAMP phosphodiesterase
MEIRVLGCYGSQLPGYNTTSFLVDRKLLIDGGTITSALSLDEQSKIESILVTHAHLDHVRDIMFLADNLNIQSSRMHSVSIFSTEGVLEHLRQYLFNNVIWPDFTQIPNRENPIIRFQTMVPELGLRIEDFQVTAVRVNHSIETVGFIIEDHTGAILFTGDTGPTERIWELALKAPDLKAIFVETSFHDEMAHIAALSGHLTPATLEMELEKLKDRNVEIYLFHMKPLQDLDSFKQAIGMIRNRNIHMLHDGQIVKI